MLGTICVDIDDGELTITARRERVLLAMLLLHANESVLTDQLIDAIWRTRAPQNARNQVQRCVHHLRRRLRDAGVDDRVIATEPGAYRALLGADCLDLLEFRRLVARARAAVQTAQLAAAAADYRAALRLWRGPAFADVDSEPVRQATAALEEERARALEECFEVELANGAAGELIAELTSLVQQHPYREALHSALMLALYRAGRRADALAAYRGARRLLHDELGTEPGTRLQQLHQAILAGRPQLDVARPASEGATPTTTTTIPRELPADVTAFTGRGETLKALDALLPDGENAVGPVVVSAITGSGGIGKTAVAVHWGHRVSARFPDGQLYLNLRGYAAGEPLRPIEALSTLLRSLGLPPEQIPTTEADASARYRSLLAGRRMLVVLDNARSVVQVRPLLPGSPECLALVTSRDRLTGLVARDGARRVTLDVLAADEAYALLSHLLGATRTGAEAEATAALAEACAYLPLALRVAAATLDEHPHRPISTLVSELSNGHRLTALAVEGDAETAVRVTFDLSYRTIPKPAQRLFRLLGLIPGRDIAAPAAAAMADLPEHEARQLLDRLASAHLVNEHAPGRYTFHDLLREYARNRADQDCTEADRAAALTRLLAWYLAAADTATALLRPNSTRLPLPPELPPLPLIPLSSRYKALDLLDTERPNLVAAVQHAAHHGPAAYAWLLGDRLRLYYLQDPSDDSLTVGRASLAAAEAHGDPRDRAAAHLVLADAHLLFSNDSQAAEHYLRSSTLAAQAGWLQGEATAENNLGSVHVGAGRPREAIRHIAKALGINQRADRTNAQASNLGNLGYVLCDLGDLHEARDKWKQALAMFRGTGNTTGIAMTHANLGRAGWLLGELRQAVDHLTESVRLHRGTGHRPGEGFALHLLAGVCRDTGERAEALRHASAAVSLVRASGLASDEALALNALAATYLSLGRHGDAASCYQDTLRVGKEQHYASIEALVGLAAARHGLRHYLEAQGHLAEALERAHTVGYQVLEAQALTCHAGLLHRLGQPAEAEGHARRALEIHRRTGHRLGEARTLAQLGRIRRAGGDTPAADQFWLAARALFNEIGAPPPAEVS